MADVAFNLILFFMLATSFGRGPQVPVELPAVNAPGGAAAAATVVVSIDARGGYAVDSRTVSSAELPELLRARLAALKDPAVVVAADQAAAWAQVVRVLDLARQLHVQHIEMSVREARR